jgi:glycosyltransferase XagB
VRASPTARRSAFGRDDTGDMHDAVRQYSFLVGRLCSEDDVWDAVRQAFKQNVRPHDTLLSEGIIAREAYVECLAQHLGVPFLTPGSVPIGSTVLTDGTGFDPEELAALASSHQASGQTITLVTPDTLDSLEPSLTQQRRLNRAVRGLKHLDPQLSAAGPIALWQLVALLIGIGLLIGGSFVAPAATRTALMICITVPFFFVVLFRVVALGVAMNGNRAPEPSARRPRTDSELPVYSVMVPLFREFEILPDLIEALSRIDYPAAKLDCMLVLEAADRDTITLARTLVLPAFMRIVVVPDRAPRTKPKALNYAMQLARGEYIAVYDAEDVPDPLQLRKAVAAFDAGGEEVVCVQASLAIHNARASWLTRQFALEYAALFEGLLPALTRYRLPVPLGGTSNHFRRGFLEMIGGWDPYNVTEDADLGMRIARAKGRIVMIQSTTWEEAPTRLRPWIGQRTRWLKGWMQTYLVHMRDPGRSLCDLGFVDFLAFQALMGGVLLSSLFHPLFYVLIAWELWAGEFLASSSGMLDQGFLFLAGFNMIAGYVSAMALAAVATVRNGRRRSSPYVLLMPLYWLLISCAAWRAMVQLAIAPHFWEKTEHSARRKPAAAMA